MYTVNRLCVFVWVFMFVWWH